LYKVLFAVLFAVSFLVVVSSAEGAFAQEKKETVEIRKPVDFKPGNTDDKIVIIKGDKEHEDVVKEISEIIDELLGINGKKSFSKTFREQWSKFSGSKDTITITVISKDKLVQAGKSAIGSGDIFIDIDDINRVKDFLSGDAAAIKKVVDKFLERILLHEFGHVLTLKDDDKTKGAKGPIVDFANKVADERDHGVTRKSYVPMVFEVTVGGKKETVPVDESTWKKECIEAAGEKFITCEDLLDETVGGKMIPIDKTSLLVAGATSYSWMIPVVLSGIGIGLFAVSRKSKN